MHVSPRALICSSMYLWQSYSFDSGTRESQSGNDRALAAGHTLKCYWFRADTTDTSDVGVGFHLT